MERVVSTPCGMTSIGARERQATIEQAALRRLEFRLAEARVGDETVDRAQRLEETVIHDPPVDGNGATMATSLAEAANAHVAVQHPEVVEEQDTRARSHDQLGGRVAPKASPPLTLVGYR